MESFARSAIRLSPTLLAIACAVSTAAACSSSDAPAPGGSAGAGAAPGSAGAAITAGATSSAGAVNGGSTATGGAGASGGSAGAAAGMSGAPTGGTSAAGSGGAAAGGAAAGSAGSAGASAGAAGSAGGSANCAGRSLSLSANASGTAKDDAYSQVVVDLMTALPIGNAKRTVEFWAYIKTSDWVGDTNEIFYYGAAGKTVAFGLDFGTPAVTGMPSNHATLNPTTDQGFNDDSGKDLGYNSSTDQWVHIAMTWDATALRTYVNGLEKITTGATDTTMLATAQGVLRIGCNPENKNCFNGWFDEFRIWNIARTDAQIKDTYNKPLTGSETGLVGYWKFDDAVGSTTAADSLKMGTTHSGMLSATMPAQLPTFGTPPAPLPLVCP